MIGIQTGKVETKIEIVVGVIQIDLFHSPLQTPLMEEIVSLHQKMKASIILIITIGTLTKIDTNTIVIIMIII